MDKEAQSLPLPWLGAQEGGSWRRPHHGCHDNTLSHHCCDYLWHCSECPHRVSTGLYAECCDSVTLGRSPSFAEEAATKPRPKEGEAVGQEGARMWPGVGTAESHGNSKHPGINHALKPREELLWPQANALRRSHSLLIISYTLYRTDNSIVTSVSCDHPRVVH